MVQQLQAEKEQKKWDSLKWDSVPVDVPEIFPVPAASRCIVIMCCQYMIVYTALAVCRTYSEFTSTPKGKVEAGLRAAAQTLTYGPMLCVLFIACRMRVEFLSHGKDEPQAWVQNCMYALTFAVLASTLLVLCVPLFTGKPLPLREGTCDLERVEESESDGKIVFYTLTAARYLILIGLYGGLAGVIVGSCTYLPPGATVDMAIELPAPAPAVLCTMILVVVFFTTQLVIAVCRSYTEFTGIEFPKLVGLMNAAATTVEFAPMLAVLFLAARMRALQHDAQPQAWAQRCMFASTGAMCLTTIMAMAVPLALGGTMKTNPVTKEHTFEVPSNLFGYMLVPVRYVSMLGFYGGALGVAYSIFAFEAPTGETLPVSPTVRCVVNLTLQFFFVYFMMTAMLTVSEITGGKIPLEKFRLFAAIENTKATLAFAPMLCVLFVTTRMYALLITDRKGAPPAWVQDGMFMSTWSLMISFLMCLGAGLVMDEVETDEDGNVVNKFSNGYVAVAVTVVRYLTMLLLYGGMVTVIFGLFVMTPETANGRGSIPVVSDTVNSTPIGDPPPGPQSVSFLGIRIA